MRSRIKKVFGVGVNDADYMVQINRAEVVNGVRKISVEWVCPFYRKWKHMLERCYDRNFLNKYPNYKGCSVIPEWHYFMTFRAWMEKQDWKNKHLDKDIISVGNKVYAPETCVFVDAKINTFLIECSANRGEWPIGVSFKKQNNKFVARCRDVFNNKSKHLGYFDTPEEAHQAWLTFKLEQAKILASQQSDPRVAEALISRYEYYTCAEVGTGSFKNVNLMSLISAKVDGKEYKF